MFGRRVCCVYFCLVRVLGCEEYLYEGGSDRPNVLRKDHVEGATPSMGVTDVSEER